MSNVLCLYLNLCVKRLLFIVFHSVLDYCLVTSLDYTFCLFRYSCSKCQTCQCLGLSNCSQLFRFVIMLQMYSETRHRGGCFLLTMIVCSREDNFKLLLHKILSTWVCCLVVITASNVI